MEPTAEPWWKQAFAILLGVGMLTGLIMEWVRPGPKLQPQWVSLDQMPAADPKVGMYLIYTASDPPTCYSYGQVRGNSVAGQPEELSWCENLIHAALSGTKKEPSFWDRDPIPVWIATVSSTKTLIRFGITSPK